MSTEPPEALDAVDRHVSRGIFQVSVLASGLTYFALGRLWLHSISGGRWLLPAFISGALLALLVNFLRPPYQSTSGRLKAFYDFLLRHTA